MKYIFFVLFFITFSIFADSQYSFKSVLDSSYLKYTKDDDGDYIIDYRTKSGRIQQVIIRNNINNFNEIPIREILSISEVYNNKAIPESLTTYLLIDNYSSKYLGNWAIHKKENTSTIVFIVKFHDNVDKEFLEAAITETAEAADALKLALIEVMGE